MMRDWFEQNILLVYSMSNLNFHMYCKSGLTIHYLKEQLIKEIHILHGIGRERAALKQLISHQRHTGGVTTSIII